MLSPPECPGGLRPGLPGSSSSKAGAKAGGCFWPSGLTVCRRRGQYLEGVRRAKGNMWVKKLLHGCRWWWCKGPGVDPIRLPARPGRWWLLELCGNPWTKEEAGRPARADCLTRRPAGPAAACLGRQRAAGPGAEGAGLPGRGAGLSARRLSLSRATLQASPGLQVRLWVRAQAGPRVGRRGRAQARRAQGIRPGPAPRTPVTPSAPPAGTRAAHGSSDSGGLAAESSRRRGATGLGLRWAAAWWPWAGPLGLGVAGASRRSEPRGRRAGAAGLGLGVSGSGGEAGGPGQGKGHGAF